jgi:ankyrin repeat protein
MLACSEGEEECVRLCVSYGANVHLKDDQGHTALYLACREVRKEGCVCVCVCVFVF